MKNLGLTFLHGLVIGIFLSFSILSVVIDKYFISRDTFRLDGIYLNGKIYKICEDR